jgi:hypothetical protein
VEIAIAAVSHEVLAGSLETKDDVGNLLVWQVILHYEFLPEVVTVNKQG